MQESLNGSELLKALPPHVAAGLPPRLHTCFLRQALPLHCALRLRHAEAAEALLDAGADPNSIEGPGGQTPLGEPPPGSCGS